MGDCLLPVIPWFKPFGNKVRKEKKNIKKKRDSQWIKTADCSNKRRYFNDRFKTC